MNLLVRSLSEGKDPARMKQEEVVACQIQEWYPSFRSVSMPTHIHPLPQRFIAYLLEDGLFLPPSSQAMPSRIYVSSPELQAENYHPWPEEDQEDDEPQLPSFPDLQEIVAASIAELGGAVFPKLNWSAPKDAAWISSSGSLKCRNFAEIVLLLKASDSLVHDLSHAFDSCDDQTFHQAPVYVLALRKWYDLRPEMEFRGFVRGGFLVAICQREMTGFYPALLGREDNLENLIFQFFSQALSEQFALEDYTFDCYVTKSSSVKLIDFNPWGAFTLPLLFSWDELEESYNRFMDLVSDLSKCIEERKIDNLRVDLMKTVKLQGEEYKNDICKEQLGRRREREFAADLNRLERYEVPSGNHTAEAAALVKLPPGATFYSKKILNNQLREHGYRIQFRIVKSEGHVQPNLRLGGGVPYDYINMGPGSGWEEFLLKANEELQEQTRDAAAGG